MAVELALMDVLPVPTLLSALSVNQDTGFREMDLVSSALADVIPATTLRLAKPVLAVTTSCPLESVLLVEMDAAVVPPQHIARSANQATTLKTTLARL
jgi:hypothetical protein